MTTATGKRLAALGIVKESNSELLPLHSGDGPPETRLSRYQRAQLARVQGELLETTTPGLKFDYRRNLVDFRLTLPKAWRDVYRYTEGGTLLGWMRFDEVHGTTEFTTDGVIVLTRDALGRCATAATVSYRIPDEAAKRPPWEWPPLTFSAQLGIVRYQYESDGDRFGRLIRTELPAPAGSK